MISCEEFEEGFPHDRSPEIVEHLRSCRYCAQFDSAMAECVHLVNSLPRLCAPAGFEFRLEKRLSGKKAIYREWNLLPRFAAFASGAALVLIAGVIYNISRQPETNIADSSPQVEELTIADSLYKDAVQDTIPEINPDPWAIGNNMQAVSANK